MVKIMLIGTIMFALLVLSTALRWKLNVPEAMISLVKRITLANQPNIEFIARYADHRGYFWGRTYLMDLATIKPGEDIGFRRLMTIERSSIDPGTGLTPTILGESYANFGPAGTLIVMFIFGVFLEWFAIHGLKKKHEVMYMCAYAFMGVFLSKVATQGFSIILISAIFPIYVAYLLLATGSRFYLRSGLFSLKGYRL
jgi:oligosaccharide repeat unit polymerase